ncbi:hypothetical protein ICW40_07430 [Actinotalea ferrariae]|uniref:hypothetical protein n=1 Tax=Actinotalea ferrariae TaxID=1386098 RepID=UPI001C8C32D7|nr:hypothetical protein [Actinotalea ferrariae]MBX9244640.1 hypothetical protein [Actinotalea ferrariae]
MTVDPIEKYSQEPADSTLRFQALQEIALELAVADYQDQPRPSLPAWCARWRFSLDNSASNLAHQAADEADARDAIATYRRTGAIPHKTFEHEFIDDILHRMDRRLGTASPVITYPPDDEERDGWPDAEATHRLLCATHHQQREPRSQRRPASTPAARTTPEQPQPAPDKFGMFLKVVGGLVLLYAALFGLSQCGGQSGGGPEDCIVEVGGCY